MSCGLGLLGSRLLEFNFQHEHTIGDTNSGKSFLQIPLGARSWMELAIKTAACCFRGRSERCAAVSLRMESKWPTTDYRCACLCEVIRPVHVAKRVGDWKASRNLVACVRGYCSSRLGNGSSAIGHIKILQALSPDNDLPSMPSMA